MHASHDAGMTPRQHAMPACLHAMPPCHASMPPCHLLLHASMSCCATHATAVAPAVQHTSRCNTHHGARCDSWIRNKTVVLLLKQDSCLVDRCLVVRSEAKARTAISKEEIHEEGIQHPRVCLQGTREDGAKVVRHSGRPRSPLREASAARACDDVTCV